MEHRLAVWRAGKTLSRRSVALSLTCAIPALLRCGATGVRAVRVIRAGAVRAYNALLRHDFFARLGTAHDRASDFLLPSATGLTLAVRVGIAVAARALVDAARLAAVGTLLVGSPGMLQPLFRHEIPARRPVAFVRRLKVGHRPSIPLFKFSVKKRRTRRGWHRRARRGPFSPRLTARARVKPPTRRQPGNRV